jgi:chemosensory pili system protein ChpC
MAKDKQLIKCVIFTLRKENVIVPEALVAEIVSVKDIETDESTPDWYLGDMKWRDTSIPLVSFEAAAGMEYARVNLNTQAIVLYAVGNGEAVSQNPYLALVMSGVPHTSSFSRQQFKLDSEAEEDHPMVSQNVRINGARVSILDVDAMVEMISEANNLSPTFINASGVEASNRPTAPEVH